MEKSTLRLPDLKDGGHSGLIRKGDSLPHLRRWGLVSPDGSRSGFTLIELLIVVAIIGILAVVAIPYYQGYMIRARLIEVENAMANVKSAVSAYRHEKGTWPDCPSITEIRNSLGVGLDAVTRISSLSVDVDDGDITAVVRNVHIMVDGETIMLRPTEHADGSFSWTWDWSADFPMHLRPRR